MRTTRLLAAIDVEHDGYLTDHDDVLGTLLDLTTDVWHAPWAGLIYRLSGFAVLIQVPQSTPSKLAASPVTVVEGTVAVPVGDLIDFLSQVAEDEVTLADCAMFFHAIQEAP